VHSSFADRRLGHSFLFGADFMVVVDLNNVNRGQFCLTSARLVCWAGH
jgi:hypothetical protein